MIPLARRIGLPLLSTILLLLLGACDSAWKDRTEIDFVLGNPTAEPLRVTIDGTPHDLKPGDHRPLTLAAGRHTLQAPLTGDIAFIVYANGSGALINPTFSTYVTSSEMYFREPDAARRLGASMNRTIELDGVPFQGMLARHDDLFIEKDWQIGAGEPFPHSVSTYDDGLRQDIRKKLFTKDEFFAYNDAGDAPRSPEPAPQVRYPPLHAFVAFHDADLQAATAPVRDIIERYQRETDPQMQIQLAQAYVQESIAMSKVYAARASELDSEDARAMQSFGAMSDVFVSARALPADPVR